MVCYDLEQPLALGLKPFQLEISLRNQQAIQFGISLVNRSICFQVVERNSQLRSDTRDAKIREYFYGRRTALYPHTFDVKFSEVHIFKIGGKF